MLISIKNIVLKIKTEPTIILVRYNRQDKYKNAKGRCWCCPFDWYFNRTEVKVAFWLGQNR